MFMGIVQVWILPEISGPRSSDDLDYHGHLRTIRRCIDWRNSRIPGRLYRGIPAFIVTLGGLLVWRGAAFLMARGETISPVDSTFKLLGGGPYGAIGSTGSWIIGMVWPVSELSP